MAELYTTYARTAYYDAKCGMSLEVRMQPWCMPTLWGGCPILFVVQETLIDPSTTLPQPPCASLSRFHLPRDLSPAGVPFCHRNVVLAVCRQSVTRDHRSADLSLVQPRGRSQSRCHGHRQEPAAVCPMRLLLRRVRFCIPAVLLRHSRANMPSRPVRLGSSPVTLAHARVTVHARAYCTACRYTTSEEAEAAIRYLGGMLLDGRPISIDR